MKQEMAEVVEIEILDRYSATGTPYPKKLTVCGGQCEGMGVYPCYAHEPTPEYQASIPGGCVMRVAEELTEHERREVEKVQREYGVQEDGYYFIRCGECGGTGRVSLWRGVWRVPREIWRSMRFVWYCGISPQFAGREPGVSYLGNLGRVLKIAVSGWF